MQLGGSDVAEEEVVGDTLKRMSGNRAQEVQGGWVGSGGGKRECSVYSRSVGVGVGVGRECMCGVTSG